MSEVSMTNLLNDLRVAATKAGSGGGEGIAQPGVQSVDFGNVFKSALDAVNASEQTSGKLKRAFELGEPGIDLPQVMVASQKASVAFQGMLEVRKQLLKAYQDVMSMQV